MFALALGTVLQKDIKKTCIGAWIQQMNSMYNKIMTDVAESKAEVNIMHYPGFWMVVCSFYVLSRWFICKDIFFYCI